MQFVKPLPFDEAIDKLGSRSPIGSTLSSSEWSDVPVALRERAMFSSRVENVRFLQRSTDLLDGYLSSSVETLPDGRTALTLGSRAQFVDIMREFALKEGMGPLDAESAGSLKDITSEARLGLIFDTQTQQAGDYGYWRQGMDADVLNEFPAQRFVRVVDVKEPRTSHSRYENQVYLKTDPIWARVINEDFGVPWGPWAWGCGHDVEDVDRTEAEALGLIAPGQQLQPDVQNFNENLKASTKGLDPDLVDKLKKEFGDQIVIEGDTMRWMNAGEKGPAIKLDEPLPFPVPKTETPTAPVSDALELKVRGGLKAAVQTGLSAIDQVHDDGVLPKIPLLNRTSSNKLGYFRPKWSPQGKAAEEIGINPKGPWPALTTVHEAGHFLDLEAIGARGAYATEAGFADMQAVIAAAEKTEAIKAYRALWKTQSGRAAEKTAYYFSKVEIWARAYAQYIAEKSGDATLLADLARVRSVSPIRQWSTQDFAPISAAIDTMFKNLNWL